MTGTPVPRGRSRARRRPRRGRLAPPLLLAALGALAVEAAQPPPEPDLSVEGMRRLGPFHLKPYLLLRDIGYDDNLRFDSPRREGDYTATFSPGVRALLRAGARGGLLLSEQADYVTFRRNADLNHWNGAARARGILLVGDSVLSLEDRHVTIRERPNNEVDRRVRRDENALTAAFGTARDRRLALRSWARWERIDYSADGAGAEDVSRKLNRDASAAAAAVDLRILPKTTVVLEGTFERNEFERREEGRDTRSVSVLPGLRFDPSASIQGEVRLGLTRVDALRRPESDYRGIVGDGRLSARVGRFGRLKASAGRSLPFSTLDENLYFVGTSWSAAYEQFLTRRLSAEALLGRGLNHYPQEVSRAGAIPFRGIRDDHVRSYQFSLRYRLDPRLSLAAVVQRTVRDSNDDFFDRDRNFYGFGTTLEL